jgi:hypothetical protein
MPALPPVPATLRIDTEFAVGTDALVIARSFWAYSGSAPNSTTCLALATTIHGYGAAEFPPVMDSNVALNATRVTDLASPSGGDATYTAFHAGTRGSSLLPGGTTFLVNYKLGRKYRGGKPRNYFPFGTAADLTSPQAWSGSLVSAVQSAVGTWAATVAATASGGTTITQQVNVSYYSGFTPFTTPSGRVKNISTLRPGGPLVNPITAIVANGVPSSQRRRNRV